MDVKTKPVPETVEPRRSCKGCARVPVCQIFRVEVEYVQKEFLDKKLDPPFQPEQLATICKYFLPVSAVRMSATLDTPEQ